MLDTYEQKYAAVQDLRQWLCGDSGRYAWREEDPKKGLERWTTGWGDGHGSGCLMMGWYMTAGVAHGLEDSNRHAEIQGGSWRDIATHLMVHEDYAKRVEEMANLGAEALGFTDVSHVITYNDGQGSVPAIAEFLDARLAVLGERAAYEVNEREMARMIHDAEVSAWIEDLEREHPTLRSKWTRKAGKGWTILLGGSDDYPELPEPDVAEDDVEAETAA